MSTSTTVFCPPTAITPFTVLTENTVRVISLSVTTPVGMKGHLVTPGPGLFKGQLRASCVTSEHTSSVSVSLTQPSSRRSSEAHYSFQCIFGFNDLQ